MMDSNRGKGNKTCIMREIHFSGLEHSNPITQMGFLAKLANTVVKKKKTLAPKCLLLFKNFQVLQK